MPPRTPGTYALVLCCAHPDRVRIGRLGDMQLRPGYYIYVGSAFGPGGLRARIGHHVRAAERPCWHIDYLRARLPIVRVWYCGLRCECEWAGRIAALPGADIPVPGFGSSDCGCPAHLVHFAALPSAQAIQRALGPDAGITVAL